MMNIALGWWRNMEKHDRKYGTILMKFLFFFTLVHPIEGRVTVSNYIMRISRVRARRMQEVNVMRIYRIDKV